MLCTNGHNNNGDANFCWKCGEPIVICTNGHSMSNNDKFCGVCGESGRQNVLEDAVDDTQRIEQISSTATFSKRRMVSIIVAVLIFAVAAGIYLKLSSPTQLQTQGERYQHALASFCRTGSQSGIDYSPKGSLTSFTMYCTVGSADFVFGYFPNPTTLNFDYESTAKIASKFPNGIEPVLTGRQWLAEATGSNQSLLDLWAALVNAKNHLGGQISFWDENAGGPFDSLSGAASSSCQSNLTSWVKNTVDAALSGFNNSDWLYEFGATSSIGLWIENEYGSYARAVVGDPILALDQLKESAHVECGTLTFLTQIAVSRFK